LSHVQLNGRISIFRGQVKRNAASKVEGHYQLIGGRFNTEMIKGLLQGSNYVYPKKKVSVSPPSE
jgi:hypothetical protein